MSGDELAGVRKPGDKGAAQHVDFAVDRGWLVTASCRGPRCWLCQRSCEVCIASLGVRSWRRWGLDRTAAGNVGVSRRICLPHLSIFLSMISSWAGVRDESATQYVDFAVDRRQSVAYGVEVAVKLYLVVVKLRLSVWVQVVLAA